MDRIIKLLWFIGQPLFLLLLHFFLYFTYFTFKFASLIKSRRRIIFLILCCYFAFFALPAYRQVLRFALNLPDPHSLSQSPPHLTTIIYDRHQQPLYKIYRDENRSLVKLNQLPNYVSIAHLAIEDQNFYRHHGFDFRAIIRAAINNIAASYRQKSKSFSEGGW